MWWLMQGKKEYERTSQNVINIKRTILQIGFKKQIYINGEKTGKK